MFDFRKKIVIFNDDNIAKYQTLNINCLVFFFIIINNTFKIIFLKTLD